MKTATSAEQFRGFTLLELIVVIAILATLMGIAYPAIMGVQENARIASSSKTCADLVAGVSSFKQDHNGIMPYYPRKAKPDKDDQIYLITEPGKDAGLLAVLTGYEDTDIKLNINNDAYIKPTRAESARDGLFGENGNELGLYDPWGKPYYVVLCEMTEGCIDPFTNQRIRRENCLVYGLGPDSDGIAPAHSGKRKVALRSGAAPKTKGKKMSKKEARRAALEAQDALNDAIIDNIYSWKKAAKK